MLLVANWCWPVARQYRIVDESRCWIVWHICGYMWWDYYWVIEAKLWGVAHFFCYGGICRRIYCYLLVEVCTLSLRQIFSSVFWKPFCCFSSVSDTIPDERGHLCSWTYCTYSLRCLFTSFLAYLLNHIGWLDDLISTFLMGTDSSIAFRQDEENLCHMDSTLFMVHSSISVLFICASKVLTSASL